MSSSIDNRIRALQKNGVVVLDPRQVYLDGNVEIERIHPGVILHPGTRLVGQRTFVGPGAIIGSEGPAVLQNSVVGEKAEVASGFLNEAVLMRSARVGSNGHIRAGTLLEEKASVAHAVGLKHTILLSFVTFGSLINFCDAIVSGGTDEKDHSEVGSGFIHFNFTAWGKSGDKATPSLVGDVVRGVFLRESRIFMGGASGLVGPQRVGFGSITAAGQVVREEVPENRLVSRPTPEISQQIDPSRVGKIERRVKLNVEYIGQLAALKAWYEHVRIPRIPNVGELGHLRIVTNEALQTIATCISERIDRLQGFVEERTGECISVQIPECTPCPLQFDLSGAYVEHVDWVRGLPETSVEVAGEWMKAIANSVSVTKSLRNTNG